MPGLATLAELSSSSSAAAATTTVTVQAAEASQTQPPQDVQKLSTVMPAVLIAGVVFLSLFLVCGLMQARRRRMQRAALQQALEAGQRRKPRKKKYGEKPRLWDVGVWGAHAEDDDLEALLPVAAQIQPASPTSDTNLGKPPGLQQLVRKPWFSSHAHRPQTPEPAVQQAQLAFIVYMPSRNRAAGESSNNVVLGTTTVPYRVDCEDESHDGFALAQILSEKCSL